jgi:hypothetical protein
MHNLATQNVILGGDFIATMCLEDKIGVFFLLLKSEDFRDFLEGNSPSDCIPTNSITTWSNRWKETHHFGVRLDRFLVNQCCVLQRGLGTSSILPYMGYDYFPVDLVISTNSKGFKPRSYFKFEKMWFADRNLIKLLHQCYDDSSFLKGSRMF